MTRRGRKLGRWSVIGVTLAVAWAVPRAIYGVVRTWKRSTDEAKSRDDRT